PSPLQKALDLVVLALTCVAVLLSAWYVALHVLGQTTPVELYRRIAATITSMVPQGLVLMATLAFLLGAVRMSTRGAVVQRLNAVEAMASIDTLCMDKTGTLTTNQLRLDRVIVLDEAVDEAGARDRLRVLAS